MAIYYYERRGRVKGGQFVATNDEQAIQLAKQSVEDLDILYRYNEITEDEFPFVILFEEKSSKAT